MSSSQPPTPLPLKSVPPKAPAPPAAAVPTRLFDERDLVFALGTLMVAVGAALVFPPAGLICPGALLVYLAVSKRG